MYPEYPYDRHISRLRLFIKKRAFQRIILNSLLIFLPLFLLLSLIHRAGWLYLSLSDKLLLVPALSILMAMFHGLKRKRAFVDELIDAEDRLGLKSRLSASYQYRLSNRKSFFGEMLLKETSGIIETIRSEEMFPGVFSRIYLIIPVFIVLLSVAFYMDITASFQKGISAGTGKEEIALKLKERLEREERYITKKEDGTISALGREMEDIIRRINKQDTRKDGILESLDLVLSDARSQDVRMADQLRSILKPADGANAMGTGIHNKGMPFERNELEKMTELLKKMFNGDIPASISSDIRRIREYMEFEEFIETVLDELRSEEISKMEYIHADIKDKAIIQKRSTGERQGRGRGSSAGESSTPVSGKNNEGDGSTKEEDEGSDSENQEGDDFELDEMFSSVPGSGKSSGRAGGADNIEGSKGVIFNEGGVSLEGERYNAQVRAITKIGSAKEKEEDMILAYEREIEEILQREDIPVNYREFIKNYFLRIGLGRDNRENGDTD